MHCYVVKWPVFRLQRGSAKSPIAPSNFSPLWIGLLPDENGLYRIDDMTGDMMLTKEQMLRNYGMKIKHYFL